MENINDLPAIMKMVLNDMYADKEIPDTAVDLWFGSMKFFSLSPDKSVFLVDSEMKKNIIKNKYLSFLSNHLKNVIGFETVCEIKSADEISETDGQEQINPQEEGDKNFDFLYKSEEDEPDFISIENSEEKDMILSYEDKYFSPSFQGDTRVSFNPDYTFENFVVGSSNKFAHAGALAVAENPGKEYNPLFFYGASGVGKTHLMYAIANKVLENDSSRKVIYVKGETFMNQMVESLKEKKTDEFREKYRKADILLLDDIQFIAKKEFTQEEFFHTFEALYEDHKQIIITSDRPPHEMDILEDRIRSRFESGLLIDIQPPDFELRLAILKKKSEDNNLDIPIDVITYLAENLNSNIRQIEGVIKKLGANYFLTGEPISMEMVKTSIPEFIRKNRDEKETVKKIIELVAKRYNTTPEEIYGRKRLKDIKNARNIAMKIIRDTTTLSLPRIGAMMGNRDYSTVHSNLLAVDKQVSSDPVLEAEINELIKEVKKL